MNAKCACALVVSASLSLLAAAAVLPALAAGAADLEGWWRFTEPDGGESADASGRDRAALLDTNRVWRVTDAPGGGALWFDGVTNVTAAADDYAYALVPDFEELTLSNAFSVAAWICPDALPAFAPILVRTGDTDEWDDGFALFVGENGALAACVRGGDDAGEVAGGALATNEWNHVALSYSGTVLKLYLNGREVASRAFASRASSDAPAPLGIGTLVGRRRVQPFAGAIADVRIWSSALSSAQVGAAYRQFLGEAMDPNGDDDGDGMPNGWEIRYGLDPRDPSDADLDSDGDGLTNLRECRLGRSPRAGARPARPSLIRSATATTL